MNYQLFGQTGLNVSQIALGTGNFGTGWGYGSSQEDAKLVLDAYLDVGGNFIDTADVYQFGQSEQILGDLLQGIRHEVVLATKFSDGASLDTNQLHKGNSRKAMLYSVEQSLRRLKTDYIDLYWVHHPDNVTPSEEILRGLEDLARAGKILYAGLSNFPAWRLSRAATIAELKNTVPIAAAQFQHSLVYREPEADLIPASQALGLGMVTWSPLGGGMLTGKYRKGEKGREEGFGGKVFQQENSIQRTAILDAVLSIANELNVSADQVAIAWAGTHGTVPIIGPKSLQQAKSNLGAIDVVLSPDQIQLLDSVSQIITSDQKRLPILNIDVKHKAIIA
ncbi:aldo/keto reductase [Acinetobacter sp. CS-2]|uniref:aldo/keto reductase n=1 Tax=Acinetobacter sp. CS-2 TaxID=2798861 RepID=UPI0019068220|nr:aldo/keto reductase [Acinetobacter sp. CS-2]QQN38552.1 aldo/keto reductase [Acinetobacter sp. CS-2]